MRFTVLLTESGRVMLEAVTDRRERGKLIEKIDGLADEPEKQGKPLTSELAGFRSVRAVGQRYRIIYKVEETIVTVYVVAVGRRKAGSKRDIYSLAQKLLNQQLVKPPKKE